MVDLTEKCCDVLGNRAEFEKQINDKDERIVELQLRLSELWLALFNLHDSASKDRITDVDVEEADKALGDS